MTTYFDPGLDPPEFTFEDLDDDIFIEPPFDPTLEIRFDFDMKIDPEPFEPLDIVEEKVEIDPVFFNPEDLAL